MSELETLLSVQEQDTVGDQLRRRRATLAERAELAQLEERIASLEARRADAGARRDELAGRQTGLEREVAGLDQRIADIERRLYSGAVSASRELQAMASEVDSLKARRSSLEDEVLLAMEEGEPLAEEVARLEAERGALDADGARLGAQLAQAEAEIDAELAAVEQARAELARRVPPDLLETYERLRARLGGVGAARLVGASCSGCHLSLPMSELARIRREPPGRVILCDQCGRILVP